MHSTKRSDPENRYYSEYLDCGKDLPELKLPKTKKKQVKFLKNYDFFVLIDRSGSMNSKIEEGAVETRWEVVRDMLKNIVKEAVSYDRDGVEVCFFDTEVVWMKEKIDNVEKVQKVFKKYEPGGLTNLADALEQTFKRHFDRKKINRKLKKDQKSIILVITDGIPNDGISEKHAQEAVRKTIIKATSKLSKKYLFKRYDPETKEPIVSTTELGIQIFQVGNNKKATEYVTNLDSTLKGAKADIVDTGDIEELNSQEGVRKAFLGAINN